MSWRHVLTWFSRHRLAPGWVSTAPAPFPVPTKVNTATGSLSSERCVCVVASINCSNAHTFAPGSLSGKMSQLWCRLHFAFLFCASVSKWRADQGWDVVTTSQMHSMTANQETDQKLSETETARLPGVSDQSANHSQLLPLHHKCTARVVRVLKCTERIVWVLISTRTTVQRPARPARCIYGAVVKAASPIIQDW